MGLIVSLLRMPLILMSILAKDKCGSAERIAEGKYIFCTKPKYHAGLHGSQGKTWRKDEQYI